MRKMNSKASNEVEAWIISIGNELLIGKVVNTNFSWLAKQLTSMGYRVKRGITVMDDFEEISWAFKTALSAGADLIISTGGLGPTYDDKTSEALAYALSRAWEINEKALEIVKRKYELAGMEITEHRIKMAKLPEGAIPLENPAGTAPGIMIKEGDSLIISLPGVPKEMKAIFNNLMDELRARTQLTVAETELYISGVPESSIAPLIDEVVKKYPEVYVKSHPRGMELGVPLLLIHLSARAQKRDEALALVKKAEGLLLSLVKDVGGEATRK